MIDLDARFIAQVFVLAFSVAMLNFSFVWWIKHRKHWYVILPFTFYYVHATLFYSLVVWAESRGMGISDLFHYPPGDLSEVWSVILRLHSMTTMLLFIIIAGANIKEIPPWKTKSSK